MIARKSVLIISTNILDSILSAVALFFITREIGAEGYGVVVFAIGFVTLFSIIGQLGFDYAHIKKVSEGKDLGKCIGTFFAIKLVFSGIMSVVLIGFILFWKNVMNRGFESSEHEIAIYIILIYQVIMLITSTFEVTFRAKMEIAKVQISYSLGVLSRVGTTIYVALAGYGPVALSITYIAGHIVQLIVSLLFFRGYQIKRPSFEYFKDYFMFSLPLIIVTASAVIMTNIDKVLIQLFWSDANVGYYGAAFRISAFINMFTLSLGTLLFPTFSSLHANRDFRGIKKLVSQSERYISMVVFPMVFGILILAVPFVNIFLSRSFSGSIPVLQILPFFALFVALEKPYETNFLGMNQPRIASYRIIIMVVINVFLNIVLIPKDIQLLGLKLAGLGETGAAIATVVAYFAGLIYSRMMAWKLNKIKGDSRVILHAIAAIIMALILYVIFYKVYTIEIIARWYHLLGASFLGLGIYIGILFLLKEFTKKDFDFFLDTLNIKKMLTYVKDELSKK